ncbi:alpha/beta fold hydrolase [Ornithinimicrobium faecis]|uniref:alpha/beta fold hydrolase n=1 Tax=Ornithinimicrobium faecis TaxID=2934158 RepID=UPI002119819F|nr:alpha/beta hydrolase [Ornithinimicrobium sp. HY1745]
MDVILLGGLWLTGDAWDAVAQGVTARGHRAVPVTLPGQGDGNDAATLQDQVASAVAAVDAADGKALVIGHSAACTLAWLAADRRPEQVAGVGLIGGFPASDGTTYADFFEPVDGQMAFPGWPAFEGPDSADLDEATRAEMEAAMVPVPVGVSRGIVQYADQRRSAVPVTLICPEFGPDEAKEWVTSGDVPELAAATALDYVDIDSGHWPMVSAPTELATIIADLADRHTAAP